MRKYDIELVAENELAVMMTAAGVDGSVSLNEHNEKNANCDWLIGD